MPKNKVKKVAGVKGGSGHMFGQMGAKPAKPGVISTLAMGKGPMYASGGKTKMFGKQTASPAKPC